MRALLSLGLMLVLGCASGSRPTFERFDMRATPSPSDYPDVAHVVLLDRGTLRFSIDPELGHPIGRLRRYVRLKVLRDEDLAIRLQDDPGTAVNGFIVRVIAPDGRQAEPKPVSQRVDERGRRWRKLALPRVPVGSVVDYTYDLYVRDLRFIAPWVFQRAIPTVRSEFALVVPQGFDIDLRFSSQGRFVDRLPERFEVEEGTRYSWSVADQPARFSEPEMPASALLAPRAHIVFRGARRAGRSFAGFDSWDTVGRWHLGRTPGWAALSDEQIREARRIGGNSDVVERALKLMEVLARDLPEASDADAPLWRTPVRPAGQLLSARQANPTNRGMLLVALLRAAGIAAEPALFAYRDRDVLLPDAPTVRALDGVAAVIRRPQGPLVLDPSQLTVSADVAAPRLQGTRIVAVGPEQAEVLRVPVSAPKASECTVEFNLQLERDGGLTGTLNARLTGAEAAALRAELWSASPEAYGRRTADFLSTRGVSLTLDTVSIRNLKDLRRPLDVAGDVRVPRATQGEGTELLIRLGRLIGGPTTPLRPTRRSPLVLGAPRQVAVRGTLTLPEDYAVGVLPPAVEPTFQAVTVALSVRTETRRRLGFQRRERWPILEVPTRDYPRFVAFLRAVREAEDAALTVTRPEEKPVEY